MQIANNQLPLRVLITRPEKKAVKLALSLEQQGIFCVNQPLFDYQPLANSQTCEALLTKTDLLIFVSVAAVEFAHASFPASHWQCKQVFAVGNATKQALQALGIDSIISPELQNSEGLLALPELNQEIENKVITIVRGNGGREHLATTLSNRGAKVSYLESYQRTWRTFTKDIAKQWYELQINCIVVTSNAILEKLVQLILAQPEQTYTKFWLHQCQWITVSQRITDNAKKLGLTHVSTTAGASDQVLTAQLQALQKS